MNFKKLVLTLLVVGLVAGFSTVSYTATDNVVTAGSNVNAARTISPGASEVVGTFKVANGSATAVDVIDKFILKKGTATIVTDTDVTGFSIYWDINENGTLDAGIDPLVDTATDAEVITIMAGTATELDVPNITLGINAGTTAWSSSREYLVVATIKAVPTAQDTYDGKALGVVLEVTNGTTATANAIDSGAGGGADDAMIAVVATQINWNAAVIKDFSSAAAAVTVIEAAAPASSVILEAVDQYGNRDIDIDGATSEATITAVKLTATGTAAAATLVADCAEGTGAADLQGAADDHGYFIAGIMITAVAGVLENDIDTLTLDGGTTDENVVLVCTEESAGLVGTVGICLAGTGVVGDLATTQGISSRGIEYTDLDQDGHLDHVTFFFNSPIYDSDNDGIPDEGTPVDCPISAFTVSNYGFVGGSAPMLSANNGGRGIFNGGPFAVTLQLVEKTTYDTGDKPQASYNAAIGNLQFAETAHAALSSIGPGDATEVDKARPILLTYKTLDSGLLTGTANNGIADGIELTLSENVTTGTSTANPATNVAAGADPGDFSFALDQNKVEDFLVTGGNVVVGNTAGVVTLPIAEETTMNTGFYPIITYNQFDAGGFTLNDNAGNAMVFDFTDNTDDNFVQIQVADAIGAQVVTITTDDTDSDGKIDKVAVEFTEDMDDSEFYYTGVTFDSGVSTFGNAGIYTPTKSSRGAVSTKVMDIILTESATGIYDTESTPTLLNDQTGSLCDLHYTEAAIYGTGQVVPAIPVAALIDGAPPLLISATTSDEYGDAGDAWDLTTRVTDGKIDTYTAVFSEVVTTQNATVGDAGSAQSILQSFSIDNPAAGVNNLTPGGDATGALDEIYDADDDYAAPTFSTVAVSGVDQSATLKFSFAQIKDGEAWNVNTGDTGMLYDVLYASTAANYITDATGNSLEDIGAGDLTETDGADPWVLMNPEVYDFFGQVGAPSEDNGNGDGYIDTFKIFFTENVYLADHTAIGGFTIDTSDAVVAAKRNTILMNLGVDSNNDTDWATWPAVPDLLAAEDDYLDVDGDGVLDTDTVGVADDVFCDFNSAYFYGTNLKDAGTLGDTEVTPLVDYDSTVSTVLDLAGNELQSFADHATTDMAKPVIIKALGILNKNEINLLFSEAVDGADGLNSDDVFGYSNEDAAGVSILSDAVTAHIGDDTRVKIRSDGNLSASDIANDLIWIKVGTVLDQSAATNAAVGDTDGILQATPQVSIRIHIDDFDAPYVTKIESQDMDGDGWIDYFLVTMSEPIDDSSMANYVAKDTMFPEQTLIAGIEGYTMEGFNLFVDAAKAKAANEALIPDIVDDALLSMKVTERSAGAGLSGIGDTGLTPAVTYGAAITLIDVEETPFSAATSAAIVTDAVGPVVMSAYAPTSTTVQITHSEAIDAATINALGYDWDLADRTFDGYDELQIFVTATAEVSAGVVELTLPADKALPAGVGQTVGFELTGLLAPGVEDLAGNAGADAVGSETTAVVTVALPTVALGAPSALVVTDMAGDNGHWLIADFIKSADHTMTNSTVRSYQFYVKIPGEGEAFTWRYFAAIAAPWYVEETGAITCYVPTPLNGEYTYGVLASSGSSGTGVVEAAKTGEVPVATLVEDGAALAGTSVSSMIEAVGGALDNTAPSAFMTVTALNNPGSNEGITVNWTKAGAAIVGYYGNTTYQLPIYDVNTYEIYRKVKGATGAFQLVGTAGSTATSFIHVFDDDVRVFQYYVKAIDDYMLANPDETVASGIRAVIAKNELEADFDSSGDVGFADFSAFASQFGMTLADNPEDFVSTFDLIEDGAVGFADFSRFASLWGTTAGKVAKAVEGMPTSDIGFVMDGEADKSASMYYVTVSVDKTENLKGFQFSMNYDTSALEFVEESVSGLVGLNMTNNKDGVLTVASMFIGDEFDGTVTIGFKSSDLKNDLAFEIVEAMVSDIDGVAVSNNLSEFAYKAPPAVYALSRNYPNPFNPTTTIDYSIPEAGNVELVIFNMAGQKVRTLVSEKQDAAYYKVVWDGRNESGESVASGLYFYKLVSGNFNKIEKMTLIK